MSKNTDFNKTELTQPPQPLLKLLAEIHAQERLNADGLYEMIVGYWEVLKTELKHNVRYRSMVPNCFAGGGNISITQTLEHQPFFNAPDETEMEQTAIDDASNRFLKVFTTETKAEEIETTSQKGGELDSTTSRRLTFIFQLRLSDGTLLIWRRNPGSKAVFAPFIRSDDRRNHMVQVREISVNIG